jgi:transcriptional regulator with XRE-family HTH domain
MHLPRVRSGKVKLPQLSVEEAFGQILRSIRNERGLSQEQLSFKSGHHRTYISLLERGKKSPSLDTIFRIAQALAVRPSDLMRSVEAELGA